MNSIGSTLKEKYIRSFSKVERWNHSLGFKNHQLFRPDNHEHEIQAGGTSSDQTLLQFPTIPLGKTLKKSE